MQENIKRIKDCLSSNKFINYSLFIILSFLTPVTLVGGLFGKYNPPNWWHSISAAYYCNTKYLFIFLMSVISILLICEKDFIYTIAGVSTAGLLFFPTYEKTLGISESLKVGILKMPLVDSGTVHIIFNTALLVCTLVLLIDYIIKSKAYLSLLLFLPIIVSMTLVIIETKLHNGGNWSFHWSTIISEGILFQTSGLIFLKRSTLR